MAVIVVTPLNCGIDKRAETPRSHNLRGAYALEEYEKRTAFVAGQVGPAFDRILKEMMLSPYMRERGLGAGDEINLVVTLKM